MSDAASNHEDVAQSLVRIPRPHNSNPPGTNHPALLLIDHCVNKKEGSDMNSIIYLVGLVVDRHGHPVVHRSRLSAAQIAIQQTSWRDYPWHLMPRRA